MTTEKQIEIAKSILESGLVTKVFHSCIMLRNDPADIYPVYQRGKEFVFTGLDDTKGLFAYIRENGDITSVPFKLDSCSLSYEVTAPLRVVFFNDNETRDHAWLLEKLAKFSFFTRVRLQKIITDKFRLVKEESPLFRSKFDGKTFYVAFDVFLTFILLQNSCEPSACITHPNPITPCPAAAPASGDSATS